MNDDQIGMAGDPIIQVDLNGNGLSDYVTASHAIGLTFIFFDLPDFSGTYYSPTESSNLMITGALSLGSSFASGDINGDNINDLVIGAKTQGIEGAAYVIYGSSSLPTTGSYSIYDLADVSISCSLDGGISDLFGDQVGTLDINGDSFDDIIVGSTHAWYEGNAQGNVYVIYGSSNLPNNIEARTQSQIVITGEGAYDHVGKYVGKGNFNNDEYEDLIFSSAYWPGPGATGQRGKIWILFGSNNPSGEYELQNNYSFISAFEGPNQGDIMCYFDHGDINGDSIDDLVMSASGYPGPINSGIVYIAYGPFNPNNTFNPATYSNRTTITPPTASNWINTKFGQAIAIYDMNEDGFDDMLFGGPGFSRPPLYLGTQTNEGGAWLMHGSSTLGQSVNPESAALITYYGDNQNQLINNPYSISFGRSVNFITSNNGRKYSAICDIDRNRIRLFPYEDYSSHKFTSNCSNLQTLDDSNGMVKDFNNDGNIDILLCGQQNSEYIAYLYINSDGEELIETIFPNIDFQVYDIDGADFDNDGDIDIALSGRLNSGSYTFKVLINNGNFSFSDSGYSLVGLSNAAVCCSDINSDGFPDLLITGRVNSSTMTVNIYLNSNGVGFTPMNNSITNVLTGVENGEIECADFNGDNRNDIFISGATNDSKLAKLYVNNSDNTFSSSTIQVTWATGVTASLVGLSPASASWADADNDGDPDLFVCGYGRNPFREYTLLYKNNGSGQFVNQYSESYMNELISGPILSDVGYGINGTGHLSTGDLDEDGSFDLFVSGAAGYYPYSENYNTCIHINNGNGRYSKNFYDEIEPVSDGYNAIADLDNDGDNDLIIVGQAQGQLISKIYLNGINGNNNCLPLLAAIEGCTNSLACNYDSLASVDDGSCTYPGCTNPLANNYNPGAGCEDGSCQYAQGCTDPAACNYDPDAIEADGSCTYPGCTDADACNFDTNAACDNGSCVYLPGSISGPQLVFVSDESTYSYPCDAGCEYVWTVSDLIGTDTLAGFVQDPSDVCEVSVAWGNNTGIAEIQLDVTCANGCSSTYEYLVQVDTGLEELQAGSVLLYPNPTSDHVTLSVSNEWLGGELRMRGLLGNLITISTITQLHHVIDVGAWEAGVYAVELEKDGVRVCKMLVKQ